MIAKKKTDLLTDKDKIDFWAKRKAANASVKRADMQRIVAQRQLGKNVSLKIDLPAFVKNAPVYILIRTSGRPEFFKRCYESALSQTYSNIVIVTHTDDPRDTYVQGDIIVKGQAYHPKTGTAPYNLYNNRLLSVVPRGEWAWFHFIDDDDMYHDDKVIENLVKKSDPYKINVARVKRWGTTVFPRAWKRQNSYQTECFFLHSVHAGIGNWWANKGGDHHYSRQITARLKVNWIENLFICKAQDGKGHGRKLDLGGKAIEPIPCDGDVDVLITTERRPELGKLGTVKRMPYEEARKLELAQKGKITFAGVTVDDRRENKRLAPENKNEIVGDRTGEKALATTERGGVGDDAATAAGELFAGNDQPQSGRDTVADTEQDIRPDTHEPRAGACAVVPDAGCPVGDQEDFIAGGPGGDMGSRLRGDSEQLPEGEEAGQVEEVQSAEGLDAVD